MPHDGAEPTPPQVTRQLAKMLEDKTFTSRPRQAELLSFIVGRALAGQDVTEEIIRQDLFPTPLYAVDSSIARRTVDLLKKSLTEYYAEHADAALVIISLPEQPPGRRVKFLAGEAYKPRFRYNARHQTAKDYLLGCHFLRSGRLNQIPDAVALFDKVLSDEPEHAGAMLHMADAFCLLIGFGILPDRRESFIVTANNFINAAALYAPEFWHTHATRGLFHFCQGEFDAGQPEFETALAIDREHTESSTFYSLFIAVNGRAKDAFLLTGFLAEEQPDIPAAQVVRAMHLFAAGCLDECETYIQKALDLDCNCWLAHLASIKLNLALGQTIKVTAHSERLKLLLDHEEYQYWIAAINAQSERAETPTNQPSL